MSTGKFSVEVDEDLAHACERGKLTEEKALLIQILRNSESGKKKPDDDGLELVPRRDCDTTR